MFLIPRSTLTISKRRLLICYLVLGPVLLLTGLAALSAAPAQANPGARLDPALTSALAAVPDQPQQAIIFLNERADLGSLPEAAPARRQTVLDRLQATATTSQAPLLATLATMAAEGHVAAVQPFWISNAIALTADAVAIQALSNRPDIGRIMLDVPLSFPDETPAPALAPISATWGLQQIGAPQTWAGLGLDGAGVTVALVDSGVDYLHPDLNANYRGNLGGGAYDHDANWFDASAPLSVTVPHDPIGHGTHVAGTAVGQNGIGVAPGASWMGVKISDDDGFVYASYILLGWQWLLAPAGNPALAPDVINNSWSSSGTDLQFWDALQALRAAGQVAVFSAGNGGPGPGSVGAPAAYTDTLAVGANAADGTLAWFSARGPSPLNGEIKPTLLAPGTRIISAAPGGGYRYLTGTSMAAPHTTGALAVLLGANPGLTEAELNALISENAIPVAATHPNMDSGWGRLDLFSAAATLVETGRLRLTLRDGSTLAPLAGPITITTPAGVSLAFATGAFGQIDVPLLPGTYQVAADIFGYAPQTIGGVVLTTGETPLTLDLAPLPAGNVRGTLYQLLLGGPIAGQIEVLGTPVTVNANASGAYSLRLPAGVYTLRARKTGYGLVDQNVTVTAGGIHSLNFGLSGGAHVLLVDQGHNFFQPVESYYRAALNEIGFAYDLVAPADPFAPLPSLATLQAYNIVIWAAPLGSPTAFASSYGQTLYNYLDQGGRLFISGQDIGDLEGVGFLTQNWWYYQLQARFLGTASPPFNLIGAPGGDYAGFNFSLNGGDGANNQTRPDHVTTAPGSLTVPLVTYTDGSVAALEAGWCEPFRITYFGFGLEGVATAETRAALLGTAIDALQAPPINTGVRFMNEPIDEFALPGEELVFTLTLQNLSETTWQRFQFSASDNSWPVTIRPATMGLDPCAAGSLTVTVTVPADVTATDLEQFTINVSAIDTPGVGDSVAFNLHPPQATVLLVDDDRWFDVEAVYGAALTANGIDFETWQVGWNEEVRGSPPAALLNAYDFVVWFTGYDWFAPVLPEEVAALTTYVAQGGRLFLTSQDYLFYHGSDPFTYNYLGVGAFFEDATPTAAFGLNDIGALAGIRGLNPLEYGAYMNYSDSVVPVAGGRASLWGNKGLPAGVARAGPGWRTVFWALPFETLAPATQPAAMSAILGWLSELGDSTFAAGVADPATGARTYTLTLRNNAIGPNQVVITNNMPVSLTLTPGSLTGGAVYDAGDRTVHWSGNLPGGASHLITYVAAPQLGLPTGNTLNNQVVVGYDRHPIPVYLSAVTGVDVPDLSPSRLIFSPGRIDGTTPIITLAVRLDNGGVTAANASARFVPPPLLHPITPTLTTSAGSAIFADGVLEWRGALTAEVPVTVTMQFTTTLPTQIVTLPLPLYLDDGVSDPYVIFTPLPVLPFRQALPLLLQ